MRKNGQGWHFLLTQLTLTLILLEQQSATAKEESIDSNNSKEFQGQKLQWKVKFNLKFIF